MEQNPEDQEKVHAPAVQPQAITIAYQKSGFAALQPDCRFIAAQLCPRNIRDRVTTTALKDIPGANPSGLLITNPSN